MDCFGTAISMSLQYGVPLSVYVEKFSHTRFEPMGHTKNLDIPIAKSLVDYIFRWLGRTFLTESQAVPPLKEAQGDSNERRCGKASTPVEEQKRRVAPKPEATTKEPVLVTRFEVIDSSVVHAGSLERLRTDTTAEESPYRNFQSDAPSCDACGNITVRSGNCYLCYNCGKSMGCS